MKFLTDFADQAVILPAALCVLAIFCLLRWPRGALAWAGVIVAMLSIVLALKLALRTCGGLAPSWAPASPSGHVASATSVYGGLAAIGTRPLAAALAVAVLIAVIVSLTRVALGVHSVPDVLAGSAIGLVAAVTVRRLAGPPPPAPRWLPAMLVLLLAAGLHGSHLNVEGGIRAFAAILRVDLPFCRPDVPLGARSASR